MESRDGKEPRQARGHPTADDNCSGSSPPVREQPNRRKPKYVTSTSRPDLDWSPKPKGIYIPFEMIQSDAYRSLSKIDQLVLAVFLSRRDYSRRRRDSGGIDQWNPNNVFNLKVPYIAITEALYQPGIMKTKAPLYPQIHRSIRKLMARGFIDLVKQGGTGKGAQNIYRLTHNWRVWRLGDSDIFEAPKMKSKKGFCGPQK